MTVNIIIVIQKESGMKRNKFSLSNYKLFTCDMGYLIPINWYEVIPGDTFQLSTALLARMSPLVAPVMHPIDIRVHHWFVPYRLIWDDFEDFITGGEDGLDATVAPYFALNSDLTTHESTLDDYMGLPPIDYTGKGINISALPFRAYSLIFNENYRDQDLVTARPFVTTSGLDSTTQYGVLASVAWQKDYFTSSRTAPQKGANITIPLTGDAPVLGLGKLTGTFNSSSGSFRESDGTNRSYNSYNLVGDGSGIDSQLGIEENGSTGYPDIRADLSQVSGVDIDDLRLALSLQRMQEARARYGSRYTEWLRYYGVKSSDARLQKPEYLGGGKQTISISEVLNHSDTDTGAMAGHGIAGMKTNRFRRFFNEHGVILTLMSVIPKSIYTTGLRRSFCKTTKEEYFQRELQGIGDQEIYNKEVYVDAADPDDVFGYQARYDEYKYHPSSIAGEFRSTLDHWHFARQFGSEPALNSTFVQCVPRKDPLQSSSTDAMYIMSSNKVVARRMMAKRGK